MKKFISIVLTLVMTFTLAVPAFAAEHQEVPVEQAQIRAQIVAIIANASSTEERDELLSNLLEKTPLAPVSSATTYTSDGGNEHVITGMPEVIESIVIDENTQVDFYSTGDFGIKELEDIGTTDIPVPYASYNYTNTYRASYTIKNIFGGKIVETFVKGYFRYDGTNIPTAYLEDADYSKGTLIFWDCSSWDDGTGKNVRDKTAYCYADAYYDWTLDVSLGGSVGGEIGGVSGEVSGEVGGGLTIQDCNVYLKLICSKSGSISATVSLED